MGHLILSSESGLHLILNFESGLLHPLVSELKKTPTAKSGRTHAGIIGVIPGRVTRGPIFAAIANARIQSRFASTPSERQIAFAAELIARGASLGSSGAGMGSGLGANGPIDTNSAVLAWVVPAGIRRNFARFSAKSVRAQTIIGIMAVVAGPTIAAGIPSAFVHLMFAGAAGPA